MPPSLTRQPRTDVFSQPKKIEISTPYDPVHLTHVGFNSDTGEFTVSESRERVAGGAYMLWLALLTPSLSLSTPLFLPGPAQGVAAASPGIRHLQARSRGKPPGCYGHCRLLPGRNTARRRRGRRLEKVRGRKGSKGQRRRLWQRCCTGQECLREARELRSIGAGRMIAGSCDLHGIHATSLSCSSYSVRHHRPQVHLGDPRRPA